MRKFLLFGMWQFITLTCFSQQTPTSQDHTEKYHYYFNRSESQHTAAMTLLIGGGALFLGGSLWAAVQVSSDWNGADATGPGILFVTGVFSMLGSIPLFLASHRNAKKARALTYFKLERGPMLHSDGMGLSSIPAISVKVPF